MNAHVIETTVSESGSISLSGLPFSPGTNVEIIVLERDGKAASKERHFTMRGMPHTYIDPTEPVALDDWEVLK